jgi:hypothetical protein
MAATANSIITPQTPYAVNANLAAITACTTRGPTANGSLAAANVIALVPVTTNGVRIDRIYVKAASTSFTAPTAAQTVTIWISDGTNAYPFDEILVTVVTPSTTVASFQGFNNYTGLVLPATWSMWVSTSITTTASTTALVVTATGAAL